MTRLVSVLLLPALLALALAALGSAQEPAPASPRATPVANGKPLKPDRQSYLGRRPYGPPTRDIAVINKKTQLIATAGGLLRTTDGGKTSKRIKLSHKHLAISVIGVDPTNRKHLVVGTGVPSMGCGGGVNDGVFESKNGGVTFKRLGPARIGKGLAVSDVHVRGNDVLISTVDASEAGVCYSRGQAAGVLRWQPAAKKWKPVRALAGPVTQIEADPREPKRLVAAVRSVGLKESRNNGKTWTTVPNLPFSSTGRYSFSWFGQAADSTSRLAVAVENAGTTGLLALALQREDSAFNYAANPPLPDGLARHCVCRSGMFFGWFDGKLYFAGTDIWQSSDEGATWANLSRKQGDLVGDLPITWYGMGQIDNRTLAWGEAGAFETRQPAKGWTPFLDRTPGDFNGFVTRSVAPFNGHESGLWCTSAPNRVRVNVQQTLQGGMCGTVVVNPVKPARAFSCFRNTCERSNDGGKTWTLAEVFPNDPSILPEPEVVYDPSDPTGNTLYVAHRGIFKSTDGGDNWTFTTGVIDIGKPDLTGLHTTTALEITGDGSALLAGTTEGRLVSMATEAPFTVEVLGKNLPARPLTGIAVDPSNPSRVYVTMDGYDGDMTRKPGHVFQSSDGGKTFVNITRNLGDQPAHDIEIGHDGRLYIAARSGAWTRRASGIGPWLLVGGLPEGQPVVDLAVSPNGGTLWLATHAAGPFRLRIDPP